MTAISPHRIALAHAFMAALADMHHDSLMYHAQIVQLMTSLAIHGAGPGAA